PLGEAPVSPPAEWRERLVKQLRAALPDGGRAGDVLEISLEELLYPPAAKPAATQTAPPEPAPPAPPVERILREKFPGLAPGGTDFAKAQADPERAYLAYLLAAKKRDTRPDLPLYTPESRDFFKKHPVTADQLERVEEKYVGAPYEVAIQEERAVVHFPSLDLTYAPLFLKKSESGWQMDFFAISQSIRTSVEKLWRFDKPEGNPYRFAFEPYFIDEAGYVIYRRRAR
ncbi:MAG: hypothetical protein AB1405_09635, partial [Bdellovibrionota bacterium]